MQQKTNEDTIRDASASIVSKEEGDSAADNDVDANENTLENLSRDTSHG